MSVSEPGKIITPWAESGLKNPIPPAANPATGRAGFDQGFSAINMTAKEAGGIPPFGQDFNGIFFQITEILRYMQAGGQPTFDASLATAIGGYPKGAMVLGSDGVTLWRSKVDSNSADPNVNPSTWGAVDVGLRGEITSPSGAFGVGYGNSTVGEELDRIVGATLSTSPSSNAAGATWSNGKRCVTVVGDSISHGAFAGNLFSHGFTRLLARSVNAELGGSSYGFTPMLALGVGQPYDSRDLHNVAFTNVGTGWVAQDGANGSGYLNGFAFRSSAIGNKIKFSLPSFQRRAAIHHANQPSGGTFTIKVNGVVADTVNTGVDSNKFAATIVNTPDNQYGVVTVEVESTTAGAIDICGISYFSDNSEPTLQNMSQSGRRARNLSAEVINEIFARSSTVIFALGQNDYSETDPAYIAATTANIDAAISAALANGTRVVVPDFCWTSATLNNWMRRQLKRLAVETGGIYIPLPDLLRKPDGTQPDSTYLVNTLGMWVDGSHPNKIGNQWIFETIAKYMNLSCTSKNAALTLHDYWVSIPLDPATSVENSAVTTPSSCKRTPSGVALRFYIEAAPTGAFPIGDYQLSTSFAARSDISGTSGTTFPIIKPFSAGSDTAVVGGVIAGLGGDILMDISVATGINDLFFSAFIP